MGSVEYAAARRKKVVTITFQLEDGILFISTNYNIDVDKTARKIMKIAMFGLIAIFIGLMIGGTLSPIESHL